MNVQLDMLSANAVRVSWDSIDIPEITGYNVYYAKIRAPNEEMTMSFPSSSNSVVFVYNARYRFQVMAVADLGGTVFAGQRSVPVEFPVGELEFLGYASILYKATFLVV